MSHTNPEHYQVGNIEPIDVIEDWELGFHLGNVVKYVARYRHRGTPIQDLEKARWYLDRKIERIKAAANEDPDASEAVG